MNNKIIKFCESHNIDWMPITVEPNEKGKTPKKLLTCNGKNNWFKNEENGFNKIQKRKDNFKNGNPDKYNFIAMDTSKVPQIDIDCPKYSDVFKKLMKTNPWTKSSTKPYGRHIFVVNDFKHPMLKNRNQFNKKYGTDVELLSGQWAWLPMSFKIRNRKGSIGNGGNYLNNMIDYSKPKTKPLKLKPKKIENKYDKIKTLVKICPNEYFNEHKGWTEMCWAIHNATNGSEEGLKIFMDKSRQVEKYKDVPDETYKDLWYKSKTECENIKTIKHILNKLVNDDLYIIPDEDKTDYEYYKEILSIVEICSHYAIAKLFNKLYKKSSYNKKYIYCVNDTEICYYLYNEYNTMKKVKTVPECLYDLITKLCRKEWKKAFEFMNNYYMSQRHTNQLMYSNKLKQLVKTNLTFIGKIENRQFRKETIKDFNQYIQDDEVINKIDNRNKVFCFKTMIHDFETRETRLIRKDDYILTHINHDLPKDNENIQKEINKTINDIFPNKSIRQYVWDIISYSLYTNKFNKFNIMLGDGGNGKGLLTDLIDSAFGPYFYMTSPSFLTSASVQNGRADEQQFNCKGKKIVMVSEPTSSKEGEVPRFNIAKVKSLVGGDKITSRALYKSSITFEPFFNLFLQTNGMPKVEEHNNAIVRRFCIIEFSTKFVENPNKENKNEKQKDCDLGKKLKTKEYYLQFLLMLFNNIEKNKLQDNDIIIPNDVKNHTKKILEEGNDVANYISNNYIIDGDNKNRISSRKLFENFQFDTGNRNINKRQVIAYLKSKMGEDAYKNVKIPFLDGKRQYGFVGIKLLNPPEEISINETNI